MFRYLPAPKTVGEPLACRLADLLLGIHIHEKDKQENENNVSAEYVG